VSAVDCGTTQRASLTQPRKRPTVLAVARAAPAIVRVACPAGVVGANDHVTKAGTRDGFAIASQHANASGVARRRSAGEPKSQARQRITLARLAAIRHAEGKRRPF
jgi:hypothetical protein